MPEAGQPEEIFDELAHLLRVPADHGEHPTALVIELGTVLVLQDP